MKLARSPLILAGVLVSGGVLLASLNWLVDPAHSKRWLWPILFLPGFWGFLEARLSSEFPSRERAAIKDFHRCVVAWLGLLVTLSLGFKLAFSIGALSPEWRTAVPRIKGVTMGLGLTIWGNYLPKLLSPWSSEKEPFDWQGVHRFVGWVGVVVGLALIAVWLFLPLHEAKPAATSIWIAFVVLGLARKIWSVASQPRPPKAPRELDDPA